MSESEVKKCPKCGGKMEARKLVPRVSLGGFLRPRGILGYTCKNCGFVELYEEKKVLSHK